MIIQSGDSAKTVDIGTQDFFFSLYSTIKVRLKRLDDIETAIHFFDTGICSSYDALECARQINLIRDRLSQIPPEDAVYDLNDITKKAPWADNISPTVTSCANLFTTTDGRDLLFEAVSILTYAHYKKVMVSIV